MLGATYIDKSLFLPECKSLMDLYIVIDGSDSISAPDFVTLQKAIASLVPQIELAPDKARIGMLVYSSTVPVTSEHAFLDHAPSVMDAAMKLQHPRDGTNTALGIQVYSRRYFIPFKLFELLVSVKVLVGSQFI